MKKKSPQENAKTSHKLGEDICSTYHQQRIILQNIKNFNKLIKTNNLIETGKKTSTGTEQETLTTEKGKMLHPIGDQRNAGIRHHVTPTGLKN